MRRGVSLAWLTLLCQLWTVAAAPAAVAETTPRQYKIEAAFLYNFFTYVTWPGHQRSQDMQEATICVHDGKALLPYLRYVSERMRRPLLTVRSVRGDDALDGCDILYIRGKGDHAPLLGHAAGKPVLTVLYENGSIDEAMIRLEQESERLAMEINHSGLTGAGFQASSRLLSIARAIR